MMSILINMQIHNTNRLSSKKDSSYAINTIKLNTIKYRHFTIPKKVK